MKRQMILWPASDVLSAGGYVDPGSSSYPWQNTPSVSLAQAWADTKAAGFDYGGGYQADAVSYGFSWIGLNGDQREMAVGFDPAPTLARYNKVTLLAWWDLATGGGTIYYGAPAAYPPRLRFMLRNRAKDGWIYGSWDNSSAARTYNANTHVPGAECPVALTWEHASHPQGGVWTQQDVSDLAVGIGFDAADPATENPRFIKHRVMKLYVLLDVEDLGGYVDNVRHASSLTLRLMRRARNAIRPIMVADKAVGEIGSRIYLSHPRGPAVGETGWGRRRLERRAGTILQRKLFPESVKIQDEVFDLHSYACLGWAAYRIDGPWSPELQGLSLLDKGRGFAHTRAQDAWSRRPGDGVLMRVLDGYPNLSYEGLAVAGGGDVSIALRNYDLMQSGWSTVASAGDFSATADTTVIMAEEQGYLSSCKLAYGAGGGAGGRQRSLGTLPRASGDFVHVRVILKNSSVPSPSTQKGEWYLKRSGGGLGAPEYWNEAGRAWTTTATYNPVPSDEPSGESIADAIPCDAAGASSDPTYYIGIGRFSANMGPVTLHGAIADVQHSTSAIAGTRPALVTLDATIARTADVHQMDQVWGRELWAHERGVAVCEIKPFWRAASLPNDAVKPLLHAQHAANTWDALQFVAKTGDDLIRFERGLNAESTYQLDCPIAGLNLTRAHVLRAWCRWLGPDGWTEYGPYSVEVGYAVFLAADGSLVGTGSVIGRLSSETAVPYSRDYLGIGCDATRQLDGYVRTWETRRNPLHQLEAIWKV